MRNAFVKTLVDMARSDERIFMLTPDLGYAVLEPFRDEFPDRFINVGIAEQNAVGIAAGLALSGKIAYVYSIIPFVTARCYEQVMVDCAYMNTNVRLVGVGAGFGYGPAGATHHSICDIASMRVLPNMSVVAPGSVDEAEYFARYSVSYNGPMYIRLGKRGEPRYGHSTRFGKMSEIFGGGEFAIISTSNMLDKCYRAAEAFKVEGRSPTLLSCSTIKPFDSEKILDLVDSYTPIITVEEHNIIGGLASAVSETIAVSGKGAKFLPIGVPDSFSHYVGSQDFIEQKMGLGDIKGRIGEFLK